MPAKKSTVKKSSKTKSSSKKDTTNVSSHDEVKLSSTTKSANKTVSKATKKTIKAETKSESTKSAKVKASDLIKRESHTPAIFKSAPKRSAHILFTLEDVRETLKKRAKEEESNTKTIRHEKRTAVQPPVKEVKKPEEDIVLKNSKHAAASLDDILGLSTSSAPVAKTNIYNNKNQTVPPKFEKYYNLLIALRKEVKDELNLHSNDTLKRSSKDDSGDSSTSVDAGTDNFDRDFALSLLSSEQEALKEIESAIQRVYNGTYGICEVTGKPIADERLEAVPFTRFSLEGQRQHEQNAKKRVQRTGAFLNEGSADNISFGDDDADS